MSVERRNWQRADTLQLIKLYKHHPQLWDTKNVTFKNRNERTKLLDKMASYFRTTHTEIVRKIKNLRTQTLACYKERETKDCTWEYYSLMQFIIPMNGNNEDGIESQDDDSIERKVEVIIEEDPFDDFNSGAQIPMENVPQDIEFADAAVSLSTPLSFATQFSSGKLTKRKKVLPFSGSQFSDSGSTEVMRIVPEDHATDEYKTFGEFVANELRGLKTETYQKQLKRAIQRAILTISEAEDAALNSQKNVGSVPCHQSLLALEK